MLKVGLIGCGGMGGTHANAYTNLKDRVQVVAVADLDEKKAGKIAELVGGAKVYATGEELIANETVDYVDICLPTFLHAEHAVMAMEKGFHVFMEKPVCLNEEEACLLLETQKKTGAQVQIGLVIRFWDEYVWLKQAVEEGTYGKVISGVFQRLSSAPKWSWNDWYHHPEMSGTAALDMHIHDVDYIRYLMGEPKKFTASAARDKDGVIQQMLVMYEYDGAVITAEGGWDFPDNYPFSMNFRVKLEKATITYDIDGLTVYTTDGRKIKPELKKAVNADIGLGLNVSDLGAYFNELEYFTRRLSEGQALERAPLDEAVESARLVWAEIEQCGGTVK